MSLISALARLEAAQTGRAQPAATVRHRHLSEHPLVFVPLTTAGEAGAPLGALVGTDRHAPRLLVVPQPRDRDLRFAFLAELADIVLPYLDGYADVVEAAERSETDPETGKRVKVEVELCADAPQLIVPSRAGVEFVRLLGRSMRFRRTAEQEPEAPHPAPPRVPLLGRWLTHFGERARVPGSSLLLALTEVLGRHWATGQSSLEDQHLGALLAWIEPPAGESGATAALRAELQRDSGGQLLCPPAGPATDPAFDNKLLAPAIERYDRARTRLAAAEDGLEADDRLGELTSAEREIRALVAGLTRPTWDAVWRGLDLLRALPEGAHVDDRWTRDRWSFTGHRDRVTAGEPPQPRRDDAVTAANKLATREREQARLDAQEALDDPLVMAGRRLAGEAFAGRSRMSSWRTARASARARARWSPCARRTGRTSGSVRRSSARSAGSRRPPSSSDTRTTAPSSCCGSSTRWGAARSRRPGPSPRRATASASRSSSTSSGVARSCPIRRRHRGRTADRRVTPRPYRCRTR